MWVGLRRVLAWLWERDEGGSVWVSRVGGWFQ